MKWILINEGVELCMDLIPNSNLEYSLYWNGLTQFKAVLPTTEWNRGCVGFGDAPSEVLFQMNKTMSEITDDEVSNILSYCGLHPTEDSVEPRDVFMEYSLVKLIAVKIGDDFVTCIDENTPFSEFKEKYLETLWDRQIQLQEKMQSNGLNLVSCGSCGTTIIHEINQEDIICHRCGFESEACNFPDYFYEGMSKR